MEEQTRNRATRLQLKQFLPVQDTENGSPLGRMVDLSVTGMMLICKQEIPVGQTFSVEISTPVGYEVPVIPVQAQSVWCRVNPNNTAHFGVGFSFSDPTDEALALLKRLMQEPGVMH